MLNNLGLAWKGMCRFPQAEEVLQRALECERQIYGQFHPNVARSLGNLAELYRELGRYADAEQLMRESLSIIETSYGGDHPRYATRLNNLAGILHLWNQSDGAERLLQRALEIDLAAYGEDHLDVARDKNNLSQLIEEKGRFVEAETLLLEAITIVAKVMNNDPPVLAEYLNNLGMLHFQMFRFEEAESELRRARAIEEAISVPIIPRSPQRCAIWLSCCRPSTILQNVRRYCVATLAIDEAYYRAGHPTVAVRHNDLATYLMECDRLDEAEQHARRALEIEEAAFGPSHTSVAQQPGKSWTGAQGTRPFE